MRLPTIKSCLECGQSLTNKGACFICISTGVDAKRWLAPSRRQHTHSVFHLAGHPANLDHKSGLS
jgi:hypothetical protein